MRSDHLAKHIKTHENKAKKLMAKKGDKLEKVSKQSPLTSTSPTVIKQEKLDDEDMKPMIYPIDTASTNYTDTTKSSNSFIDPSTISSQSSNSQVKPSIEDYYQSYHPYQYQYGSNYFHHQNSRFYQDKNYFYGHMMSPEQNRGSIFSSPPAATTAPQSNNVVPTQATTNSVQNQQNGFYHQQSSNYQNSNSSQSSSDPNYLLNFNASINNTININTSNLMIINNSTTNTLTNNIYQSQHALQQQQQQ